MCTAISSKFNSTLRCTYHGVCRGTLYQLNSDFRYEAGVHRVQRVPATETQGRVHTSTATVAVMPKVDDVEVNINPSDIDIHSARSGGAGGQNVNKVCERLYLCTEQFALCHLSQCMYCCMSGRNSYRPDTQTNGNSSLYYDT